MSGYPHHHLFRPSGGDSNWGHPPPPPHLSHPQLLHPSTIYPSQPSPFPPPPPTLNPNFSLLDLNAFLNHYHNFYPPPIPNPNFSLPTPNPIPIPTPPPPAFSQNPTDAAASNPREVLGKIDRAAEHIRDELVAAGRNVSSWKVLQSALLRVNVDAETCLGLRVEQLPSLHGLMETEGRINAFIHCFVKVRKITSLYDLEVAICKNEDIEHFEELGLGPLLRHALVLHYFSMDSEATEVFKISTEEIIRLLHMYMMKPKIKKHTVEGFLDFIVTKRSVDHKEMLGIRIFSLGVHASAMREANASERAALWRSLQEIKPKKNKRSRMRVPIFTLLKQRLEKQFHDISHQSELSSVVHNNGEEDTLVSSSSEDEGINDYLHDDRGNDHGTGKPFGSSKSLKSRVGECSYMSDHPSSSQKHNESNESVKKKRKYKNLSCPIAVSPKLCKRKKVEIDSLPTKSDSKNQVVNDMLEGLDLAIANNRLRMFITKWKEACREQPLAEVLWTMLRSYDTKYKRTRKVMKMFAAYPLLGLLNVAVSSIKCGMWDNMLDPQELAKTVTDDDPEYVEQSIKNALPVNTEHATGYGQSIGILAKKKNVCYQLGLVKYLNLLCWLTSHKFESQWSDKRESSGINKNA